MENILYQIFTSDYDRTSFEDNVLKPIFKESAQKFVLYDKDGEQEIRLTETDLRTAKKVVKYGEFTTDDNRKVELYEITVEDFSKVKIARVGLGALVKKLIIGNNAVFATFRYEDTRDKHWRFSFIAYDSFFQDGQVQTTETNPNRYTYVFGDEHETYRNATDRFLELESKNKITVKDIQGAFAVEAMSIEFFDEYRETHYAKFIKYLTGDEFVKKGGKYELVPVQNPSPFLASVFNGDKVTARDFCKKLLGQIVFLYFLQKKGWMGSPTGNYKSADGDKNFMQNFFNQAGADDKFYPVWLTKLFYDTLNKERENDDFEMPDKSIVKIPYLNGGLFDKESEKHDFLTFPKELFTDLFEFFNRFNFTIYENSPEEHTVAVDPEMLGHIFENLLEDNKDKGTFYTPKEIVHYMTQESLIEYLVTHLGENTKEGIDLFVKQKDKEQLSVEQLNEINNLLDRVKICDPAIGSGAFPMGLLQEIFTLKERIAFDLGYSVWSPATVKENIIQNSIYGVDIEKGAVDIAQLRFWLSLIVDADVPKALPNLAYKIVVGNSLVSKFENEVIEIDWSADSAKGGFFAQELIEKKIELLKQISEKQKLYFKAKGQKKEKLAKEIRRLKLDIISTELKVMIETKGTTLDGNAKPSKRQMEGFLQTEGWRKVLTKTELLKNNNKPFSHFDWALDFPELLNPLIIEDKDKRGFDIVIGNPPYGVSIKGDYRDSVLRVLGKVPDFEIYYYFIEKAYELSKNKATLSYIIPNTYLFNTNASNYRIELLNRWKITEILDCTKFSIFQTATVRNTINLWQKNTSEKIGFRKTKNQNTFSELVKQERLFLTKNDLFEMSQNWGLAFMLDKKIIDIVNSIKTDKTELISYFPEISQGLIAYDAYKGQSKEIIASRAYHYNSFDKTDLKKWLWGEDVTRYKVVWNGKEYIDYCDGIANPREQKYFIGERLLIREITNPSIFAGIAYEEMYNDPAIIIVKSNDIYSVKILSAILNSKLATFYHFNNSPKATKGAFPKILVKDIKEFPINIPKKIEMFELLVDIVITLNQKDEFKVNELVKNEIIAKYFEEVIDGCVFDLYFTDHMRAKNLDITQLVEKEITKITDLSGFSTMDDKLKSEIIWKLYEILSHPDHPVKNRILKFPISSPDILKPILEN